MKAQKHFLDFDEADAAVTVGLMMCAKKTEPHELFYHLNLVNNFFLSRKEDIKISGKYFDHFFLRYDGYDAETKTGFKIFRNRSIRAEEKLIPAELFIDEENEKYLLNSYPEVDYIISGTDIVPDFSLILLPDHLLFKIQHYTLDTHNPLNNIIQYYE